MGKQTPSGYFVGAKPKRVGALPDAGALEDHLTALDMPRYRLWGGPSADRTELVMSEMVVSEMVASEIVVVSGDVAVVRLRALGVPGEASGPHLCVLP